MDQITDNVRIGLVTKPHGVKGALKVIPLTPDLERFEGLSKILLEKNGCTTPATVASVQLRKDYVLVQLEGLHKPEDANFWRNAYVCIDINDRIPLEEDHYFIDDLIGLEVYLEGTKFARLVDVLQPGANDVYVLEREGKETVYFPALKSTVEKIDLAAGRMDILMPDGLLEEGE